MQERELAMAGELVFHEGEKTEGENGRRKGLRTLPYRLLLLCALWLELFLELGCFIKLTGTAPDERILIVGAAVCGVFWLCFFSGGKRLRFLLLIVYLAVAAFLLWQYFYLARDGFFELGNSVSDLIYNYYKVSIGYAQVTESAAASTAVFLAFAVQVTGACHAWVLFRAKGVGLSVLIFSVVALSGLAVGIVPEGAYFSGLVFCALFQYVLRRYTEHFPARGQEKQQACSALFYGVLAAVLGIVVSCILSEDVYWHDMGMKEKKQLLQQELNKLAAMPVWAKVSDTVADALGLRAPDGGDGKKTESTIKIGGLNSGHFSRAGKLVFDNDTALVVTMPEYDRAVYLKGYTGARYTRTGWERLSSSACEEYEVLSGQYGMSAQEQGYRLMDLFYNGMGAVMWRDYNWGEAPILRQGSMQVEYVTANRRYVYMPYYTDPGEFGDCRYEEDGYLSSRSRRESYCFTFHMPSQEFLFRFADCSERQIMNSRFAAFYRWYSGDGTDRQRAFEESYREFVYRYYTEMPEGFEELADLVAGAADATVDGKIKAVQRYLSDYEYTLEPGEMPEDADFVKYFLYENRKGYCVHFASSAVLLLRSLGVPARYAEGYMITAGDIKQAADSGSETLSHLWEPYDAAHEKMEDAVYSRTVMQKRIEVRDYSAHAWVEVYRDGLGWILVEVTCGYMTDTKAGARPREHEEAVAGLPSPTPVPIRKITPTPLPENTPVPTMPHEEKPTNTPAVIITPQPSPVQEPTVTIPVPGGKNPQGGQGEGAGKTFAQRYQELPSWMRAVFLALLAGVFVLLLIFARYQIAWSVRARSGKTRRGKVLWYYLQMEKILSRQGISVLPQEAYEDFARRVERMDGFGTDDFVRCQRTALMAGFGRGHVTAEDTLVLADNYQKMREALFGQAFCVQRWYLKFIKLY